LSFNVALLQAEIFGFITVVKSPYIVERLVKLPDLIFQGKFDVILLQELWSAKLAPFIAKAKEHGYDLFFGADRGYEDGLAIFVKSTLLKDAKHKRLRWHPFEHQDPIENFPGVGVQRGFLHLEFETPKLGKLHIYNTHLQSFRKYWKKRNFQARELGLSVEEHTAPEDVVIVGGDINASPYFREDTWVNLDGDLTKSWWRNSLAYGLLLHYGGLDDAMVMGLPADLADIDVVAAKKFRSYQEACAEKHLSFTATDCNSLNHKQYVQHEPPSRQDHIFMRDDFGRAKVTDRGIVFTERMDFGGGLFIEPSDHYGVYVKIAVGKAG
jgi:exonuclease III